MKYSPLISVVIPIFNGEKYLKEAIDSIINQSYSNFELILIDDASNDTSKEIILAFKDERIKYIQNPKNLGIGLSRRIGIESSSGKYIALLDQDDIAYSDRLKMQVEFMDSNPQLGASSGHADVIDSTGKLTGKRIEASIGKKLEAELIFQYVFNNPASIYKKEAIVLAGNFRDEYCEDYSLLIRIIKNYKIANLPEVLIKYRIHGENTSIQKLDKMLEGEKNCMRLIFQLLNLKYEEDELELLYSLKPGQKANTSITIDHFHRVLIRVLNQNQKVKLFDPKSLRKVLSKKWYELNLLHPEPSLFLFIKSPLLFLSKIKLKHFRILIRNRIIMFFSQ